MGDLHSSDLTVLFAGLAVLLVASHAFGELARRVGQPMVIGEMLAGLLLGPTCFGWIAPGVQSWLF
ncbi:MAG TPA: cation:proton antiporter, partial [Planctomycetaceae bacterium]|nr:cation:proton antiporter [Planctomycetaceae bacterium]